MALVTGMNHVAVLTDDLDRFVEFYTSVFDLDVVFRETTPAFRHAILRTGPDSWLHPAEMHGNPHGTAVPAMFDRATSTTSPSPSHPRKPSKPCANGSSTEPPTTATSTTSAPSTACGSKTPTACASSSSSSSTPNCTASTNPAP